MIFFININISSAILTPHISEVDINNPCNTIWYHLDSWTYNYSYNYNYRWYYNWYPIWSYNTKCIIKTDLWNTWLIFWKYKEYLLSNKWFFFEWKWFYYSNFIIEFLNILFIIFLYFLILYIYYRNINKIKKYKLVKVILFILVLIYLLIKLIPITLAWCNVEINYHFFSQINDFILLIFLFSFIDIWISSKYSGLTFIKASPPIYILIFILFLYIIWEFYYFWIIGLSYFLYFWYFFSINILLLYLFKWKNIIHKSTRGEKLVLTFILMFLIINVIPVSTSSCW